MKKKIAALMIAVACMLTLSAAPAMAGAAANVATSWQNSAIVVENFNFGNAYGTSSTKLPAQTQTALTVGYWESFLLAFLVFGN